MINIKTQDEIKVITDGGKKLARVKNSLREAVKEGVSAYDIEELATSLIKNEGAEPSFKMVPDYSWSTCINVNEGLVHGIPKKEVVFKKGDLVSVDVGLFYEGFHTDTSFSVGVDPSEEVEKFLKVGEEALEKAISQAKTGNHVFDISKAIEDTISKAGYTPIRALVGHGVGKELHEDPQIPCFVPGAIDASPALASGMVLAIEVMYAQGTADVEVLPDGWTIAMRDGKISGLFEETIVIGNEGAKIVTS
jgi:methionyl aminopeptidase